MSRKKMRSKILNRRNKLLSFSHLKKKKKKKKINLSHQSSEVGTVATKVGGRRDQVPVYAISLNKKESEKDKYEVLRKSEKDKFEVGNREG
jgi:hypothetical protein